MEPMTHIAFALFLGGFLYASWVIGDSITRFHLWLEATHRGTS